jgi:hypothetical protein
MRKKIEWQWEQLDEATWRAKVMGGWVLLHVKTFSVRGGKNNSDSQSESMQFIADRDHEWTIVPPIQAVEAAKPTVKADDFAPNK